MQTPTRKRLLCSIPFQNLPHKCEVVQRHGRAVSAFHFSVPPLLWHEKDKGLLVTPPTLLTPVAALKQGGFYQGQLCRVHPHKRMETGSESEPLSLRVAPETFGYQSIWTSLAFDSWNWQVPCCIQNMCECILKSYSVFSQNSIFGSVQHCKNIYFSWRLICQTHGMVGNLLF